MISESFNVKLKFTKCKVEIHPQGEAHESTGLKVCREVGRG